MTLPTATRLAFIGSVVSIVLNLVGHIGFLRNLLIEPFWLIASLFTQGSLAMFLLTLSRSQKSDQ